MHRSSALLLLTISLAWAGDPPKEKANPVGIVVLDNCDPEYRWKPAFQDNLTLFDSTGKTSFRVNGFNVCRSIGSSRAIAADPARQCIWVIENVEHRVRRFDLAGKETLAIEEVTGSAIAVDPQTGNLWALEGGGQIGRGRTVVYDPAGARVAMYDITGWDIAYDSKAKAFWIVDKKLTKVVAATGQVVFSKKIAVWCASSIDVNPRDGTAWVAVRKHSQQNGSRNRLLRFAANGKELVSVELEDKRPFRVSVDALDGSVWVANLRKSVLRFSARGDLVAEHSVPALSVQVDPAGGDVWVVTPTDVQRLDPKGKVKVSAKHAGRTSQAWIAALE